MPTGSCREQGAHVNYSQEVARSQRYFNPLSLLIYDAVLYGVISKFAWGSSISRLDAHYKKYASSNHLEVGVGTGYLLDRIRFESNAPRLALMDLSASCLEKTRQKVARYAPEVYTQNLLEPIAHSPAPFDSIGINYVMHCVPGSFAEKGIAFRNLTKLLSDHGVLFGTSVLSESVHKNLLARPFMWLMNAMGVFNNRRDNATELKTALETCGKLVYFEIVGVTAFFAIKKC
jgi:2-polyprenyl-3-methyl-5-hydroxy-6-metoxy-1,4-benzoquinol methylase